jgi:hypothetical protein
MSKEQQTNISTAECKSQDTRVDVKKKIANVKYESAKGVIKTAIAVGTKTKDNSTTSLIFEGKEYANAQEWIKNVFNNSGKSCNIQFSSIAVMETTPRPKMYVPPSNKCPFGRYF